MNIKLIIYHLSFIIRKSRGFTLIELMVAISITAVLGTLGIAGFINYNKVQVLQTSASEVVTMLNLAKSRAQSQIKPSSLCPEPNNLNGYTVVIDAPLIYRLELNCSDGSHPVIEEQNKELPTSLNFNSDISFFFPVQTGVVQASGPLTISDSGGKTKTISVNSLGGVIVVPPPTPTPTLKPFACGDSVTFVYKGSPVTYGTVSHNSKCWLDRNLGATKVAEAYNDCVSYPDNCAYGDLFQWGRLDDGHQTRTSGTTTTLSSSDKPGHGNFIYGMGSPLDWRDLQNDNLWQGVSGINNPCPSDWRLPAFAEWDTERTSWSSNNSAGAFSSPLKLTMAGYRHRNTAAINPLIGGYWSNSVNSANAFYLYFNNENAQIYSDPRANGFSVRCIKD